ncbi:MAG: hypothetical protein V3V30_05880 [Parvularculaceae bacterium]
MKNLLFATAGAVALVCGHTAGAAWAHGPADGNGNSAEKMVASSDLIFYGQVVNIEYRTSRPTDQEPNGVPHTFVTYQIEDILRGNAPNEKLVMRFAGGSDGRGGIYMETTTPSFANGQTDILFVTGGDQECPLVDCVDGRYRVAGGKIFNGWGVPIQSLEKGIRIGGKPRIDLNVMEVPRVPFQSLVSRPEMKKLMAGELKGKSMKEMEAVYKAEAPLINYISYEAPTHRPANSGKRLEDSGTASPPIETFGEGMSAAEFTSEIKKIAKTAPAPRHKVGMADPSKPFTVKPPQVSGFKTTGAPVKLNEEELKELGSLKEGNDLSGRDLKFPPVLDRGDLKRPKLDGDLILKEQPNLTVPPSDKKDESGDDTDEDNSKKDD